jgi:hypothetical protein
MCARLAPSSPSLHHPPPASIAPVLSGLAAAVRCERCSTPLPRHDDTMRGQTDRTLCTECYRQNPSSIRITLRVPRPRPRIHIPSGLLHHSWKGIQWAIAVEHGSDASPVITSPCRASFSIRMACPTLRLAYNAERTSIVQSAGGP